jgi:hypothetical protein
MDEQTKVVTDARPSASAEGQVEYVCPSCHRKVCRTTKPHRCVCGAMIVIKQDNQEP